MHDETEETGKTGLTKTDADWREELDPHQFHVDSTNKGAITVNRSVLFVYVRCT